jgi:hypothetical protein
MKAREGMIKEGRCRGEVEIERESSIRRSRGKHQEQFITFAVDICMDENL